MNDDEFIATLTSLTNPNKPKNMVHGIKIDDGIPPDVLKIKTDLMLKDWKFTIACRQHCLIQLKMLKNQQNTFLTNRSVG